MGGLGDGAAVDGNDVADARVKMGEVGDRVGTISGGMEAMRAGAVDKMDAVWEELREVRDEIEEVGSVLNAQRRFLKSEMEGSGNSVRTGVGVMKEMAREIRGEVRGRSATDDP